MEELPTELDIHPHYLLDTPRGCEQFLLYWRPNLCILSQQIQPRRVTRPCLKFKGGWFTYLLVIIITIFFRAANSSSSLFCDSRQ